MLNKKYFFILLGLIGVNDIVLHNIVGAEQLADTQVQQVEAIKEEASGVIVTVESPILSLRPATELSNLTPVFWCGGQPCSNDPWILLLTSELSTKEEASGVMVTVESPMLSLRLAAELSDPTPVFGCEGQPWPHDFWTLWLTSKLSMESRKECLLGCEAATLRHLDHLDGNTHEVEYRKSLRKHIKKMLANITQPSVWAPENDPLIACFNDPIAFAKILMREALESQYLSVKEGLIQLAHKWKCPVEVVEELLLVNAAVVASIMQIASGMDMLEIMSNIESLAACKNMTSLHKYIEMRTVEVKRITETLFRLTTGCQSDDDIKKISLEYYMNIYDQVRDRLNWIKKVTNTRQIPLHALEPNLVTGTYYLDADGEVIRIDAKSTADTIMLLANIRNEKYGNCGYVARQKPDSVTLKYMVASGLLKRFVDLEVKQLSGDTSIDDIERERRTRQWLDIRTEIAKWACEKPQTLEERTQHIIRSCELADKLPFSGLTTCMLHCSEGAHFFIYNVANCFVDVNGLDSRSNIQRYGHGKVSVPGHALPVAVITHPGDEQQLFTVLQYLRYQRYLIYHDCMAWLNDLLPSETLTEEEELYLGMLKKYNLSLSPMRLKQVDSMPTEEVL